jgi:hypothetical protein
MLEFEIRSRAARSPHASELLTPARRFPECPNHFRITSLYKHAQQLPWNHIVAENMGGRVPRPTPISQSGTGAARVVCHLGDKPAANRAQPAADRNQDGIIVESNLLERCSNMHSALT